MTYEKIAKECHLGPSDTVLEMGSGRGRGGFFLSHFFGCHVIGVERIPQFVKLANYIVSQFRLKKIQFHCRDMFTVECFHASFIYLYGTCLEEFEIKKLITLFHRFKQKAKKTKILTISYPLTDYDKQGIFQVEKVFEVDFPWGQTHAYLNRFQDKKDE